MTDFDKLRYSSRLEYYGPIVAMEFARAQLPPSWGLAIARQESAFRARVSTLTGGDGKRGGSYGICQMSLKTARGLGFGGEVEQLLDPHVCSQLAAKLCVDLSRRYHAVFADVASAYNSGKPMDRAPKSTREVYVPNVVRYEREFAAGKDYTAKV